MDYAKMSASSRAPWRKSTIALMLLIALCAVSCKSQKATLKQQNHRQTNEATQTHSRTESAAAHTVDSRTEDHTAVHETRTEQTEVTDWSAPDSLGQQYPLRTTTTITTTCRGQQNDVTTTGSRSANVQTTTDTDTNHNLQQQEQTKTDSDTSTQTTTPTWLIALIIAIVAIAALILYLFLKRYHIL